LRREEEAATTREIDSEAGRAQRAIERSRHPLGKTCRAAMGGFVLWRQVGKKD